ncbi:MAG: glycosyltransferase family 4 protein [Lachnospiraceae bacterium]|nr:glycosyltransferase family 4 protein [Lachnospiraceae bacterium]
MKHHIQRFKDIICDYKPDVIQIWGSEYPWCYEMVEASRELGLIGKVVIYIQGLVSVYLKHYLSGIPNEYMTVADIYGNTIEKDVQRLSLQAENEVKAFRNSKYVMGRTEWDRGCSFAINSQLIYHHCAEVLRDEFYNNIGSWNIDLCEPHSIFVSQASYPIKGFHYLLKALPIVLERYPDTKVYVGGADIIHGSDATAYGIYLRNLMEENGVGNAVFFMGQLNVLQMIERYIKANVYVSASSIENSSNSICEAMLIGVPTVASFVGGVPGIIEHHINGLLYPETETDMLAYYIIECFEHKDLCSELSRQSVSFAREFNSKDRAVSELVAAYRSIV